MENGARVRGGWREEGMPAEDGRYDIVAHARHLYRSLMDRMLGAFLVSSSTNVNVAFLDSVRGLAVILVVLFHTWSFAGHSQIRLAIPATGIGINITPVLANGDAGVQLFFVLSAFLLSQAWLKADYRHSPAVDIRRYFRHRLFRILPGYYCCLFIMLLFFVPTIIPAGAVYSHDGLRAIGIHVVFMQYFFPFTSSSWINGSLWTLTIEMMLYLLLPWAVLLFLRNRWLITLPVLALVNIAWLWVWTTHLPIIDGIVHYESNLVASFKVPDLTIRYFIARQFPAHLITFGLGIALANLWCRYQSRPAERGIARLLSDRRAAWAYFAAGWVVLIFSFSGDYRQQSTRAGWYLREISVSVGFVLILAGLLWGGQALQAHSSPVLLRLVGIVGYSAYLWHLPIIMLFTRFPDVAGRTPTDQFWTTLARIAPAVLLVSIFFYLTVERPFLIIGRRRTVTSEGTVPSALAGRHATAAIPSRDGERNGTLRGVAPVPVQEPTAPVPSGE